MDKVLELTIEEFKEAMKAAGTRRVYLVWDDVERRVLASHAFLEPWADELARDRVDYQRHEGIFLEIGRQSDCLLGAFVHNTTRGQAAGGVRYWSYDRFADYLNDGIRLAKGMTHKNALAGLWWGGGKGVVARPENWRDPEVRRVVFREYGDFISSLQGCYVTAEDVGADTSDMYQVLTGTRFTTCIPVETGGSGNPSVPTARGVVTGMEAALDYRGMGTLQDKTVAVMGTGHVGVPLIRFLLEKGVQRSWEPMWTRKTSGWSKRSFPPNGSKYAWWSPAIFPFWRRRWILWLPAPWEEFSTAIPFPISGRGLSVEPPIISYGIRRRTVRR